MIKDISFKNSFVYLITASICLALASIVLFRINHWSAPVLLLPVILLGFHYRQRLTVFWRAGLVGLILAVILFSGIRNFTLMHSNLVNSPEYDFFHFWLAGRIAAEGLNFYEPSNFQALAHPFNPSPEFTREIIEVGFWYPPPSIFLFLPLGWFERDTALLVWYVMNTCVLIGIVFLLWQTFLKESGLIGFILTVALVLTFPATNSTIEYAQTNFISLLTLLLFWRDNTHWRGGVWLALGIITKPFMALLLIYLLLQRRWRVMAGVFITVTGISLLGLLVFGPATFFSYITLNPTAKIPTWLFDELLLSSLYPFMWRQSTKYLGDTSLVQPAFAVIAIILLGITVWLARRLAGLYDEWVLALILSLALLIYPNTTTHYYVVLLALFLLCWRDRYKLSNSFLAILTFITIEFAFIGHGGGWSDFAFVAIVLNWLVFLAVGIRLMMKTTPSDGLQNYETTPHLS